MVGRQVHANSFWHGLHPYFLLSGDGVGGKTHFFWSETAGVSISDLLTNESPVRPLRSSENGFAQFSEEDQELVKVHLLAVDLPFAMFYLRETTPKIFCFLRPMRPKTYHFSVYIL